MSSRASSGRLSVSIFAVVVSTSFACGGPVDPSKWRDKPIASLDAEQVHGLCVHNLGAYRRAIPRADWFTHYCAGRALTLGALSSQPQTKETCRERLVECNPTPPIEEKSPEEDCARVDPAEAKTCQAPVERLQACIAERTTAAASVIAAVHSGEICDAKEPLRALDLLGGPACRQIKAECPAFNLALPGFTRGIK